MIHHGLNEPKQLIVRLPDLQLRRVVHSRRSLSIAFRGEQPSVFCEKRLQEPTVRNLLCTERHGRS